MTGKGYVIKVGDTIFPNALLAPSGYKNTPDRRQDKDSYTDGLGETHRQILPRKRTTIKVKTIDNMTYGQKRIVQAFFPNRDKVIAEVWNDERNVYQTMVCYVPDVEYSVKYIDKDLNFHYDSMEFEFIDYGGQV